MTVLTVLQGSTQEIPLVHAQLAPSPSVAKPPHTQRPHRLGIPLLYNDMAPTTFALPPPDLRRPPLIAHTKYVHVLRAYRQPRDPADSAIGRIPHATAQGHIQEKGAFLPVDYQKTVAIRVAMNAYSLRFLDASHQIDSDKPDSSETTTVKLAIVTHYAEHDDPVRHLKTMHWKINDRNHHPTIQIAIHTVGTIGAVTRHQIPKLAG